MVVVVCLVCFGFRQGKTVCGLVCVLFQDDAVGLEAAGSTEGGAREDGSPGPRRRKGFPNQDHGGLRASTGREGALPRNKSMGMTSRPGTCSESLTGDYSKQDPRLRLKLFHLPVLSLYMFVLVPSI